MDQKLMDTLNVLMADLLLSQRSLLAFKRKVGGLLEKQR